MTSLTPRRLLPVALLATLAALAAGCASGKSKPSDEPIPSSTPETRTSSTRNTVAADEISPSPGEPIEKVLQGRISGVDVSTTSGGEVQVRIRGGGRSLSGGDPLYVVDGIAITPGPGGALSGISPYDIESIRVLKDAADLAMYGSRGANGVILVKTKKAKRPARQ